MRLAATSKIHIRYYVRKNYIVYFFLRWKYSETNLNTYNTVKLVQLKEILSFICQGESSNVKVKFKWKSRFKWVIMGRPLYRTVIEM